MKIKICGITNHQDALLACELGADAVGFIFYKNSKRYIEYDQARKIIIKLPESVLKIGVFVNVEPQLINIISKEIGLTGIQLHGDESNDIVNKIKMPVWKTFRVNDKFDFSVLEEYTNCKIMLDTFSNIEYGGTGNNFDWNIIPKEIRENIILAGGISSSNVIDVYSNIKPAWVDVSSSLEKRPGNKDENKMKIFFNVINKLRTN